MSPADDEVRPNLVLRLRLPSLGEGLVGGRLDLEPREHLFVVAVFRAERRRVPIAVVRLRLNPDSLNRQVVLPSAVAPQGKPVRSKPARTLTTSTMTAIGTVICTTARTMTRTRCLSASATLAKFIPKILLSLSVSGLSLSRETACLDFVLGVLLSFCKSV